MTSLFGKLFSPAAWRTPSRQNNDDDDDDDNGADEANNDNDTENTNATSQATDFEIPADADPEPVPEFEGDGWKTMIENGTADDFIAKIVSKYMPDEIWDGDATAAAASKATSEAAASEPRVGSKRKHPPKASKMSVAANGNAIDDAFEIERICGEEYADLLAGEGTLQLSQLETLTPAYLRRVLREHGHADDAEAGVADKWPAMAQAILNGETWARVKLMRDAAPPAAAGAGAAAATAASSSGGAVGSPIGGGGRKTRNSQQTADLSTSSPAAIGAASKSPRATTKSSSSKASSTAVTPKKSAIAAKATPKSRRKAPK